MIIGGWSRLDRVRSVVVVVYMTCSITLQIHAYYPSMSVVFFSLLFPPFSRSVFVPRLSVWRDLRWRDVERHTHARMRDLMGSGRGVRPRAGVEKGWARMNLVGLSTPFCILRGGRM
ncbi:unnamed protein product [Sphacelaria rigidula]